MDTSVLAKSFEKIGARVQVIPTFPQLSRRLLPFGNLPPANGFSVDVRRDKMGEYFQIRTNPGIDFKAVEVRPDDRHLLLLAENDTGKHKFLCGHDERQWFVAAVPERVLGVKDVRSAKEALKPNEVLSRQHQTVAPMEGRRSRHNKVYQRQGEWFFMPMKDMPEPKPALILKNEPVQRGGSKPHKCEYLYREGGETVYVSHIAPNGLTESEYKTLLRKDPSKQKENWRVMRRDAGVFVKGRITHTDHATLVLSGWHRVLPNREGEAAAGRFNRFLD